MIVSGCDTGDHDWTGVQVTESWLWVRWCEDCAAVDLDYIKDQVYSRMEQDRREMRHLSVYRCGIGQDFYHAWRAICLQRDFRGAWSALRRGFRYMGNRVRERRWRSVRNQLKGWMAEPYADGGITWDHCGVGWTRAGAVKSFHRRQAKHWIKAHPMTPYRGDDECAHCQVVNR